MVIKDSYIVLLPKYWYKYTGYNIGLDTNIISYLIFQVTLYQYLDIP